jgi:hypothetical protein
MTISRGQMPRQQYGLGSFVKSIGKGVKSAVSGVKDLIKSDAGKMLGLAALGYGLGGGKLFGGTGFNFKNIPGMTTLFGTGNLPPSMGLGVDKGIIGGLVDKLGLGVAKGEKPTLGQFGKVFAIGSLGGAALEALTASGADEEELKNIRDVDTLKSYLRDGYMKLNPDAGPMQVDRFVEGQTYEYRADGGRIGYADGMNDPSDLPRGLQIDTTTRNPIPENALQEEIESVVRIMMGPGSAGIGEPEDGTMKGYQFFRKQYLPKKITELSENYGYSEDEIYKMLNLKVREFQESPELLQKPKMAMGGRMGYAFGNDPEQNAVEASGIMNLPLNQNPAGATELDLRETGGFIPPVGVKEKEDDIPAMLSNNEFVFTADAVRGMGDGDVNKGAQRMYDMMKKLEGGGRV